MATLLTPNVPDLTFSPAHYRVAELFATRLTECPIVAYYPVKTRLHLGQNPMNALNFIDESDTRQKWIDSTGRRNWVPTDYTKICSEHFKEDDFETVSPGTRTLRKSSVPTLNILKLYKDMKLDPKTRTCLTIKNYKSVISKQETILRRLQASAQVYKSRNHKLKLMLKNMQERRLIDEMDDLNVPDI